MRRFELNEDLYSIKSVYIPSDTWFHLDPNSPKIGT